MGNCPTEDFVVETVGFETTTFCVCEPPTSRMRSYLFIISVRGLWQVRVVGESWGAARVPHQPGIVLPWSCCFQLPVGTPSEHPQGFGDPSKGELERFLLLPAQKRTLGLFSRWWHPTFCLDTRSPSLLLPTLGLSSPHHTTVVTPLCPFKPACRGSFWTCLHVGLATTPFCIA